MIKKRYQLACLITCALFKQAAVAQTAMQAFPLSDVRLLKSPFLAAEQTDMSYMLKLDPDRLLAPFLREAGLKPKAKSYGNWENEGLDGHTAGHYLTALAQMYAATGKPVFKNRLDYMVSELKRCQDNNKDGYLGGVPGSMEMWAKLKNGDFSLFDKKWVPWYNLHKLFAGLRDAYLIGGNIQAKEVLVKFTDWAADETSGLTEQQMQSMLNTEHGGMNEVFADVAMITGEKKYLALAKRFDHQAILTPLEKREDKLNGLHANTQIPKVIGFERIAELNNDKHLDNAARFFWETVVTNRSIAIGGNSVREHFNPSNDFTSMIESEQGPETCNSYNMLKLTRMLFLTRPDAKYTDYYERTLYNHILSSQHPGKGGFVYFTPIRPQHYRVYSQPDEDFWCCVGTGMENHGKYGELIYSHTGKDVYVNLFIPSVLNWKAEGLKLTQVNNFPFSERSELRVDVSKPKLFTMCIRQPAWVKSSRYEIQVNGRKVQDIKISNGYASVSRLWKPGDKVTIILPMADKLEYLPDHSEWAAVVHGPVVLAAATDTTKLIGLWADGSRYGHIAGGPLYSLEQSPLLVNNNEQLSTQLKPVAGKTLTFSMAGMIEQPRYKKLQLTPFFELHDARYMLYWPVAKPGEVAKRERQLAGGDDMLELAEKTVDQVSPGEQQPESDHFMEFADSQTGIFNNRHWRDAKGYFSYQMRVNPSVKTLRVTYYGGDSGRAFNVFINNRLLKHVVLDGSKGDTFFSEEYAIPQDILKANSALTVKFEADKGSLAGGVFDVRLLK